MDGSDSERDESGGEKGVNRSLEEDFVRTYIIKNRRERLLFELHGSKRQDAVGRFCHCADDLLIESRIKSKGQYILKDIEARLLASAAQTCYVISYSLGIDGKMLRKQEVLDEIIGRGMASIAIFDDFVIIETEQVQGPAIKYILEK